MIRNPWPAMILAALGWGTSGVATRSALGQDLGPYQLNAIRVVVAVVLVLGYLLVSRRSLAATAAEWRLGAVQGIANLAGPYLLLTSALQYASAGFVGLLVALVPIATAAWAHYLVAGESLTVRKLAGLTIALVGVGVLLLSGDSGLDQGGRPLLAFGLSLAGVFLIGFSGAFARARAGEYDPVRLSAVQFIVGAVVIVVAAAVVEGRPGEVSRHAAAMVLYLAVLGTAMPFLLFFSVLRVVSATKASLIGYLVPVVAVITGAVVLNERLTAGILLGGALILAGVVATDRLERTAAAPLGATRKVLGRSP